MGRKVFFGLCDSSYRIRNKKVIINWLHSVAAREGRVIDELCVVVCSDKFILGNNRKFLNHDYETDVITFDYCEGNRINGEVLISIDTVRYNAKKFSNSVRTELNRTIVHGVLHLCGYSDSTVTERQVMREKEDFYLEMLKRLVVPRET